MQCVEKTLLHDMTSNPQARHPPGQNGDAHCNPPQRLIVISLILTILTETSAPPSRAHVPANIHTLIPEAVPPHPAEFPGSCQVTRASISSCSCLRLASYIICPLINP